MFKSIDHVGISVKDRERSVKFYEQHFGFIKYYEGDTPIEGIEKIIFMRNGNIVIELMHMPKSINNGYHLCLKSDDFDADYARLINAGIEVETQAHEARARETGEEGWKRAMFVGPDGEKIEIRG